MVVAEASSRRRRRPGSSVSPHVRRRRLGWRAALVVEDDPLGVEVVRHDQRRRRAAVTRRRRAVARPPGSPRSSSVGPTDLGCRDPHVHALEALVEVDAVLARDRTGSPVHLDVAERVVLDDPARRHAAARSPITVGAIVVGRRRSAIDRRPDDRCRQSSRALGRGAELRDASAHRHGVADGDRGGGRALVKTKMPSDVRVVGVGLGVLDAEAVARTAVTTPGTSRRHVSSARCAGALDRRGCAAGDRRGEAHRASLPCPAGR